MINNICFKGRQLPPSKVVCVGRNYAEHIKELNNAVPTEPVVFIKPNSAVSDKLLVPKGEVLHYEGEMAFLVEQGDLVAVGFGLDLTKRQVQNRLKSQGLPWERAKAFDQSALFSEFVPITDGIEILSLELFINGQLRQQGGCNMMLYSPLELLQEIKSFISLVDGDVLMTGTPAGVGEVIAGDVFLGRIRSGERLLVEANWVAAEG